MALYSKLTAYPPLGRLTIIPPGQDNVQITVIIEWHTICPPMPFETSISYAPSNTTKHHSQWLTQRLTKSPSKQRPYLLDAEDEQRLVFTTNLARRDIFDNGQSEDLQTDKHPTIFTIKLRTDPRAPWQWISVLDGTKNGELVFQDEIKAIPRGITSNHDSSLESLLTGVTLNKAEFSVTQTQTGPNTWLLESKTSIPPSTDNTLSTLPLAQLQFIRFFSIIRLEPYWLGPRQGNGPFFHTEEDCLVVSFMLSNGNIVTFVVLGWVDDVYQVLRSDGQGGLAIAAQNDSVEGAAQEKKKFKAVMSIGLEFRTTLRLAMDEVRRIVLLSEKICELSERTKEISSSLDLSASEASNTQWIDSLSFCTWNALGQDLTQIKILTALEQLKKNNIQISTLLIDDNWQTLGPTKADSDHPFHKGWADMEANTSIAPTGLKDLVSTIRTKYPGIRDIGVWHALMGYWGGMSPSGRIAKEYPTTKVDTLLMNSEPALVTTIAPDHLHKFYDDFYSFLRSSDITFVKTDAQHMISMYQTPQDRRDLISTYQSAWTSAHLKHFGGKAISCMSQTPQALFHSLLQTSTPAIVHRNSDDFFPKFPNSHAWHIWANAHNAHFTQHLNIVLDWDMFQTDHDFSAYHAAARCVSGGPILITDTPGQHDVQLLDQMTARAPGGSAVSLRTKPGTAVNVFDLYTDGGILKVGAGTNCGAALIAVFNTTEQEVRGMIHVGEFEGIDQDNVKEILVRGHRSQEVFGPIPLAVTGKPTHQTGDFDSEQVEIETNQLIHVRLGSRGWDILTAQPILPVDMSPNTCIKTCVLGLMGKMSGAAAILSSSMSVTDEKLNVRIGLKALGRLGVWFDRADAATKGKVEARVQGSQVNDRFLKLIVLPENKGDNYHSDKAKMSTGAVTAGGFVSMPHIWEVDVEAFWNQQEMWDESCQEVVVELTIG